MAIIGVALALAALALGAEVALSNTGGTDVELFGRTLTDVAVGVVFLAGAAALLVLMLGTMLASASISRLRRVRGERRAEAKAETRRKSELQNALSETADENDRLRRELAEERINQDTLGGVAVPPQVVTTEAARVGGRHRLKATK